MAAPLRANGKLDTAKPKRGKAAKRVKAVC
jgi:hypothetical protein